MSFEQLFWEMGGEIIMFSFLFVFGILVCIIDNEPIKKED